MVFTAQTLRDSAVRPKRRHCPAPPTAALGGNHGMKSGARRQLMKRGVEEFTFSRKGKERLREKTFRFQEQD